MTPRRRRLARRAPAVAILIGAGALLAGAPSADAHPYLVRTEPAPGSTVPSDTTQLRLLFTERIDGPYATVTLVGPGNHRRGTDVRVNGTSVVATTGRVPPGPYQVEWSVVGDDGHRVDGRYALGLGRPPAPRPSAAAAGRANGVGSAAERAVLVALDIALAAAVLTIVVPGAGEGRAWRRLRAWLWGAAVVAAVVAAASAASSTAAWWSSVTGRLALQRVVATLAVFPVALGAARGPRLRRAYAAVATVNLLVAVALSTHAMAASTGRLAQVGVMTLHLVAAAVWLATVLAVLTTRTPRRLWLVASISAVTVVATGVVNTRAEVGHAVALVTSIYGRVLDAKVALVAVMVVLGALAMRRVHVRLRRAEAVAGIGVVALAGILGQLPSPAATPAFSQRHSFPAGSPVATTSTGDALVTVTMTPGRAGLNRLVAVVERPDENDIPSALTGIDAIGVTAACACAPGGAVTRLTATDGGPALGGTIAVPRPGRWTLRLDTPTGPATADVDVATTPSADDIVIGVPGDLSGPDSETCQDSLVGLEVAAAEVNQRAVAAGRALRIVAVDTHKREPAASLAALRSAGARVVASPCGAPDSVGALERVASSSQTPVIGGDGPGSAWTWPTAATPDVEGRAIAAQVRRQGGGRVLVVTGAAARQHAIAAAATAALAAGGVAPVTLAASEADVTAAQIREQQPDVVVFAVSAAEATPLLQALARVDPGWGPPRGSIGTSAMMSTRLISRGGEWFKQGRVSLASETSPADSSSLAYATRLQAWFPGRHPSIEGVRGYLTGWLIANVVRQSPDAAPASVRRALSSGLRSFVFGPTRLKWQGDQRGAQAMAFYRTVFTNPLALAGLPGTVGHAGVFVGRGAFVQVTPFLDGSER